MESLIWLVGLAVSSKAVAVYLMYKKGECFLYGKSIVHNHVKERRVKEMSISNILVIVEFETKWQTTE